MTPPMKFVRRLVALCLCVLSITEPTLAVDEAVSKRREQAIDKAMAYLPTQAQASDGSFNSAAGPAVTALVTAGVLRQGRSPDDPLVAKALKFLEGFVKDDG